MKIKFLSILTLLLANVIVAQSSKKVDQYKLEYKDKVSIGMNIVDDTFTGMNGLFESTSEWHTGSFPSRFSYETLLINNVNIEGVITVNTYKAGKIVNAVALTEELKYTAFDINGKYHLVDLLYIPYIDPFATLGLGYTKIEDEGRATANYGFGFNIWLAENTDSSSVRENIWSHLGVIFQAQGKSSFQQKTYGNQIQYGLGLVYRFK